MTLAHWSNLFVYASMTVYAMAFVAFAASFAAVRAGRTDRSTVESPRAAKDVSVSVAGPGGVPALSLASAAGPPPVGSQGALGEDQGTFGRMEGSSRGTQGALARTDRSDAALQPGRRAANIGMSLTWLALGLLVAAIVLRGVWAGRAPWGNMYEYSLASAAAMTGVFLAVSLRRDVRWLGLPVTMASLVTLGVAVLLLYNDSPQLVPALKSYWLAIHVSAAIISGGAFTVGAAATVLYLVADRAERDAAGLVQPRPGARGFLSGAASRAAASVAARLPDSGTLDAVSYRVNAFVFPLWTFAIIAGSIWAEDAWGRYWGWDPKETWAFITWLVYAGYLHARATAGWRGRKAAVVALVGFAAFLVNFFGVNLFVSGLHSYAGV